jgi:hypothetical protein
MNKDIYSLLVTIALVLTLTKNSHGKFYQNKPKMYGTNDTAILNLLSQLEYKLERNLLKDNDYYVLAYLIKIINERKRYLGVDERPDYWYSRQG